MTAAHSRLGLVRVLEETKNLLHIVHPQHGYDFWAQRREFDDLCFLIRKPALSKAA
jgi:hypothetical protein